MLHNEISCFSADNVFNADETGLFWQLPPSKTGHSKVFFGFYVFGFRIYTVLNFRGAVHIRKEIEGAHHCFGGSQHVGNREASSARHRKVS